jgi:ATP/maltotriose-dependent transcriptional regulator MalT
LNRFDDDPAMLLVALASAYHRAGLCGADLVADMGGPGVSVPGRAAPRLASALRASPVRFVLMLDDLHELQSPACHDVLGVVISGIPRGSQLVAASRSEQPHLPKLRASGDALEVGASDLALDAAGARQIFSQAQVSLAPQQAVAVTERTEGWPVGLYLAALIAKKGNSQDRARLPGPARSASPGRRTGRRVRRRRSLLDESRMPRPWLTPSFRCLVGCSGLDCHGDRAKVPGHRPDVGITGSSQVAEPA